ncbi:MAG TPA: double-cubane-cluster-containing anaerobic reductase [Syntrophales bacterium]|nr:double-cubane-cluster-containing anaerobic reductase [Syntrophales bacterium]HQJ30974.1 double-cubane-cluster-containing anaerobic reductase [Syntrophales bacterium]
MTVFDTPGPYLINDRYRTDPVGRFLDFLIKKREEGAPVVGLYCGYAPLELIRAAGAVPVSLCASSQRTVPAAEEVLPANLCPLIKSSYGFIHTDSCPIFALSEAVIGETTCDGKKKMFELISHLKPTHVMDLPNLPEGRGVGDQWLKTVEKLKEFLETTFQRIITAARLEEEIRETNRKSSLIDGFFDCLTRHPPPVHWEEIYDVIALDPVSTGEELATLMAGVAARLEERIAAGICFGTPSSPRVLVTGCPIGGDALKVLKIVEEAGGVVVALEACSGMKGYSLRVEEGTDDPLRAVAAATLKIPCSCMSPNQGRLDMLDEMIARFKPDVVIDVILHACHGYNVESFKIRKHIQERHGLPFLKIETDYSAGDVEQIRTRVEALFESL